MECRIMMEPVDEDHCKCPQCGTEVWYKYSEPSESDDEIAELMQESYNRHAQTDVLMGGAIQFSGGSKNGKSNKKQLMKKLPTSEIYKRLATTPNKILKSPGRPKKSVDGNNSPAV
jgi:hypothetical protein